MNRFSTAALLALVLATGCVRDRTDDEKGKAEPGTAQAAPPNYADLSYDDDPELTPEELDRQRLNDDWASVVTLDTTGAGIAVNNPEKWEGITAREVNRGPVFLPLTGGDIGGPSVLRVQILLDRALFSPGIMDGRWGKNTGKAVYFFQQREGLKTTGRVDSATFNRLAEVAGKPQELVRGHRLSAEDVEGPFVEMPELIQAQAKLECSCYESLSEKLSEMFHATPELLEKLNPGVDLNTLRAGQTVNVPNVRDASARAQGQVAELAVSGQGSYVHALDAEGRILYHFPSTLGATYDPSPQGNFQVVSVTKDPWWHYQPDIIESAPDTATEARVPPGPNNRVGAVWMKLSVPHYGIHGTNKPETIGYATSAGCVRLTNWDALFLADRIGRNTPVRFRDIQGRRGGTDFEGSNAGAGSSDSARSSTRSRSGSSTAPSGRSTTRDTAASPSRSGSGSRSRADTASKGRGGKMGTVSRDTTRG